MKIIEYYNWQTGRLPEQRDGWGLHQSGCVSYLPMWLLFTIMGFGIAFYDHEWFPRSWWRFRLGRFAWRKRIAAASQPAGEKAPQPPVVYLNWHGSNPPGRGDIYRHGVRLDLAVWWMLTIFGFGMVLYDPMVNGRFVTSDFENADGHRYRLLRAAIGRFEFIPKVTRHHGATPRRANV